MADAGGATAACVRASVCARACVCVRARVALQLLKCEAADLGCVMGVDFAAGDRVLQFVGKPPADWQLLAALA